MSHPKINMIDNASIKGREDKYTTIYVDLNKVLKCWQISLFSFEWLTSDGQIRTPAQLPDKERQKFETILENIKNGIDLERPILGIGVLDNIEIGSRRDVLLTLYSQGLKSLSVHVFKSLEEEFSEYLQL